MSSVDSGSTGRPFIDPGSVPLAEIPATIGRLEEFKAALWCRLVTPSPTAPPHYAPSSPTLLTVPQVAAQLKLTRARVYELIRTGELPAVAIGRYRRVAPAALQAWVVARGNGNGGR